MIERLALMFLRRMLACTSTSNCQAEAEYQAFHSENAKLLISLSLSLPLSRCRGSLSITLLPIITPDPRTPSGLLKTTSQ